MEMLNNCEVLQHEETAFEITAAPQTDYFNDGYSNHKIANAPVFCEQIDFNFIATVKVEPEFAASYDAGTLMIFDDADHWFKAAFEMTDLGYTSIVSVVTNSISDDCNSERVSEKAVWLKVIRKGPYWSILYSLDGQNWKMVRYFTLKLAKEVRVGVSAQSPVGKGCRVQFSEFSITENHCTDLRKGE
jgi:uncharacterized protein